jgi:hypothetical protein
MQDHTLEAELAGALLAALPFGEKKNMPPRFIDCLVNLTQTD